MTNMRQSFGDGSRGAGGKLRRECMATHCDCHGGPIATSIAISNSPIEDTCDGFYDAAFFA